MKYVARALVVLFIAALCVLFLFASLADPLFFYTTCGTGGAIAFVAFVGWLLEKADL